MELNEYFYWYSASVCIIPALCIHKIPVPSQAAGFCVTGSSDDCSSHFSLCLAASGPGQRKWKLNFLPLAGFLPWWHLIIPFVLCAMHPAPWPLVLKKTTLDLRIFSLLFVFGKPGSIRNSPQQCSDGVAVGWETWTAMVKWLKCMFENW